MKPDRFWNMTRHLHDDKITNRSTKVALGAGMGLLAVGTGVWPALAGVAVTMAAVSTVQGLWENYKREKSEITRTMLYEAHGQLIDPHCSESSEKKAHSYHNFYEMLERFSKTNTITSEHLEMMVNLRDKTVSTSKATLYTSMVHRLNLATSTMVKTWSDRLAQKYYELAMDIKLSNRLSDSIKNIQTIEKARSMIDMAMKNRDYNAPNLAKREKLLAKLESLNNELTKGFSLDGFEQPSIFAPEAMSKLLIAIERERALLKSEQVTFFSMKLWAPDATEIADAVVNAQDTARLAWISEDTPFEQLKNDKFKTPLELLEGHEKLHNVLRHSHGRRVKLWGFSEFEAVDNLPKNIARDLTYIDSTDPTYKKMHDLQQETEKFRRATLTGIANEDYAKLNNKDLFAQRSDALIDRAHLVGRYCVLCEYLGWDDALNKIKQTLSDLSNSLTGVKVLGLDPATLGKLTPEEGAASLHQVQNTIEKLHSRLITNPARMATSLEIHNHAELSVT